MAETEQAKQKRQALRLASVAAQHRRTAEGAEAAAIKFARDVASLREIADATGNSHMTVKRMAEGADPG